MLRAELQRRRRGGVQLKLRGNTDEASHRDAVCLHNKTLMYAHARAHTQTHSCPMIYFFFTNSKHPEKCAGAAECDLFTLRRQLQRSDSNARGETSISRRRAEHGAENGEWCAANKKNTWDAPACTRRHYAPRC